MQIQGEGGTGKSLVIKKVTEYFKLVGQESHLCQAAFTRIAASLIKGSMLHQLAMLHQANKMLSRKSIDRLHAIWGRIKYLIINKVLMISKQTLADVNKMISVGKQVEGKNNSTIPFGGVNVILVGDFHQFPPVIGVGKGRGALYAPSYNNHGPKAIAGGELYQNFTTVVLLTQQFQNKDPVWQEILHRSRYGKCAAEDLAIIWSIILDPVRDKGLFTAHDSPWQTAVLVTLRHSVWNKWNDLASRNHCRRTGQKLILSHAYDTYNNQPLDQTLKIRVQNQMLSEEDGKVSKGDPGNLPDVVQLAKGMSVMVTYNIEAELDIASSARGVIEKVILHNEDNTGSAEPGDTWTMNVAHPPACVLVCLERTKAESLAGLDPGVMPIVPIRNRFIMPLPGGRRITLYREQLPLTPAYSFTDYRSQGQSIPYVIIDIVTPPSGGLTPFNAYVALSRSVGHKTARLLWDFDDSLFTMAPDKNLTDLDKQLAKLDATTRNPPKCP